MIGPPVTASFGQSAYPVREGATVSVAVRLSAAHQGVRGVTVPILIGGGTASEADYEVATDVTFEAGETQQTVSFAANDDDLVEGPETVEFAFGTPPAGVTIGATGTTTVTLADADPAQIDFTVATSEVAEGGETTFTFAFVQAVAFERDQTIDLIVGGSATAGDDFTSWTPQQDAPAPYAITFPAGAVRSSATIRVVDDSEAESAVETITLSATLASTNASLGSRTVSIPPSDVPDTPVVTIEQDGPVSEGEDATFTLSRTDAQNLPPTSTLTVRVEVSATGSTLGGSRPGTVTFAAGSRHADVGRGDARRHGGGGGRDGDRSHPASTSNPRIPDRRGEPRHGHGQRQRRGGVHARRRRHRGRRRRRGPRHHHGGRRHLRERRRPSPSASLAAPLPVRTSASATTAAKR